MSHICRTCLEDIDDSNCVNLGDGRNDVKMQLTECIPELDLDLIPNAHLCVYCARVLQASYEFKLRCLNSEEVLREHMKDRILPDLDVIKTDFHPVSEFYSVESLGSGMEVIYIPEHDEQETVEPFIDENCTELPLPDPTNDDDESPPKVFLSRVKGEKRKLLSQVRYASKNVEQTYHCTDCDFKTTRSFLLKRHSVSHDDIKTYTKSQLRAHKSTHEDVPPNLKITIKIPNGVNKSYRCTKCDYQTVNGKKLKRHVKTHKVDKYECGKCVYTTGNKRYFEQHKTIHGIKPNALLQCPECPFADERSLKRHMRKHACRAKFKCHLCTYSALALQTLKKHLRIH